MKIIDKVKILPMGWFKRYKRNVPELETNNNNIKGSSMWNDILKTIIKVLPIGLILKVLMMELKTFIESTENEFDDSGYIIIRTIFEKVGWLDENDADLKTAKDTVLGK